MPLNSQKILLLYIKIIIKMATELIKASSDIQEFQLIWNDIEWSIIEGEKNPLLIDLYTVVSR